MAFPTASGQPSYSGTFIPEIWSGKLVEKFYAATVFGEIANTDYEGEISGMGDKVIIRTVPSITIRDYQQGANLQTEKPESPNVTLNIDQGKYFQFIVDSVAKMQSDLNLMDEWARDASEQMKIAVDKTILGSIYTSAATANKGLTAGVQTGLFNLGTTGTPFIVTPANVVEAITSMSAVADEQNWPEEGRYLILPPWFRYIVMNSDLKNASLAGDDASILRNGRLGMIDRWNLYVSNNLTSVLDSTFLCFHVIAGHKSGLTFASQMTEMDTLKSERTFGEIVRGLNVYGFSVIKPESIIDFYCRKG